MIVYDNYAIEKEHNYVAFSARAITAYEQDDFVEMNSVPVHWYEALRTKIDFKNYDQYCVCTLARRHGFFNRMTDHKGIWALSEFPKGLAEGSYDVDQGRVYWGVMQTANEPAWYRICSAMILLPVGEPFPSDLIMQMWSDEHIGFDIFPDKSFLRHLSDMLPNAYLINYSDNEACRLELYGFQVENKFELFDIYPK